MLPSKHQMEMLSTVDTLTNTGLVMMAVVGFAAILLVTLTERD